VGRLTAQKGFDRLIDACAQLSVPYRLQIIGEGPDRPKLEEAIARRNLRDRIRLLGWQENPYPYLKNADLVVCSSRYEGLSTVVTEALILGKAVVTTPCNGMAELLGNSEYGLITEDLCDGLTRMLTEQGLREHYEAMSARRGGDLRGAELARRTEAFFTELLEGTSQ
jgi:glycosyltransferase involved in cell wall biosynthesis